MTLLSNRDLSLMRTTAGAALPDTCVIQGQTFVSDLGGGGTISWTSSGTVDCRLAPLLRSAQAEGETGERISANADFVVTLPYNTTVSTESRLVISGSTFNVEAVRDRSWPLTKRVEAAKVS